MPLHGPVGELGRPTLDAVAALGDTVADPTAHLHVGDDAWRARATAGDGRFAAAWATDGDTLVAYAERNRDDVAGHHRLALLAAPDAGARLVDLGAPLLNRLLTGHEDEVRWWISDADARHEEIAARTGLRLFRRLHQMRVTLPLPADVVAAEPACTVRPFRPGVDEDALLAVNRRAFARHPEQGRMTREQLDARLAEPWFDPAGCLLHDDEDGNLNGFCWTKTFADAEPPLGEIHVICVDPAAAGHRLGGALTVAGLDHLARTGLRDGVLFVEADNDRAIRLYERLGFRIARTDTAYRGRGRG